MNNAILRCFQDLDLFDSDFITYLFLFSHIILETNK